MKMTAKKKLLIVIGAVVAVAAAAPGKTCQQIRYVIKSY